MLLRCGRLPVSCLVVILLALTACASGGGPAASGPDTKVEVFSWWAGPGEKEGLDALVSRFRSANPGVEFINAAVAGGAGTNAKAVLTARLESDDPPDSYQVHAGQELASDIGAGLVEDVSYLYDQQGWRDKLPSGLVRAITVDGKIYSVPVNIHRSNLMWYSPTVLARAGIAAPPTTWAELLAQAEPLRARGIDALAIGPGWTQKHLLENVLLGEVGADAYTGLWNGTTDWTSPDVLAALGVFTKVLAVSDIRSAAGDWQPALAKVLSGAAAYTVMGDWADAYLGRSRKLTFGTDYAAVVAPGTGGVFNFLSDSFTLAKGAPHRSAAERWLITCGSVAGQDAFNPQKGSIPARIDSDRSRYTGYLATALADWQDPATTIVGSLTHGVVASTPWNAAIDAALETFVADHDAAAFAAAVSRAYDATR